MSYYTKLEVGIFGENADDEGFYSKVVEFARHAKTVDADGWASQSGCCLLYTSDAADE